MSSNGEMPSVLTKNVVLPVRGFWCGQDMRECESLNRLISVQGNLCFAEAAKTYFIACIYFAVGKGWSH